MNLGALKLKAAFAKRDPANQVAFAKELGLDQGNLSKLLVGKKIPGLVTRKRLFERLGIDVLDWDGEVSSEAPKETSPNVP